MKYKATREIFKINKQRKEMNVLHVALFEFRKFRAESFKKWKDERLEALREIKKEYGPNVKDKHGRRVQSII